MITDNNDYSDKKKKKSNQICCDGVNIEILIWKGKKFVEKKKNQFRLCVFVFLWSPRVILDYISFPL